MPKGKSRKRTYRLRRTEPIPLPQDTSGLHPVHAPEVPETCQARSGNLDCCLDSLHNIVGSKHLYRAPDGTLINWF